MNEECSSGWNEFRHDELGMTEDVKDLVIFPVH